MYLLEDESVATAKLAAAKQALYQAHFTLKAEWIEAAFVVAAAAKGTEGYGAADAIGFIETHACTDDPFESPLEELKASATSYKYSGEAAMDLATAGVAAQEDGRVRNGGQPRTPWTMDTLRISTVRRPYPLAGLLSNGHQPNPIPSSTCPDPSSYPDPRTLPYNADGAPYDEPSSPPAQARSLSPTLSASSPSPATTAAALETEVAPPLKPPMPPLSSQDKDAVASLSSLGFSDQEALDAVSY